MLPFKPWMVLLILLHSQGSNQARQPPSITKFAPKDLVNRNEVKFKEPNSLKLPCEASSLNLTWTWKHNGSVITETRGGPFSLSKDGTLRGSYLSTEHSGTYQCFVKDRISGVEVFSRKLQVAVTVVGKFTNTRGVVKKITLGKPFSFQCPEHTPSYAAAYNWVGNGNHWIQFSRNKRRGISPDGGLYISYVTQEDIDEIRDEKGIKCRISAANKFQESGILKLENTNAGDSDPGTLHSPSWAVVPASEEIAIEGRSKTLYCFASGRPTPKITWKKNGQPITHGQNSFMIPSVFYGRRLYINNVNRTEHQDQYSCQAENSENNDRPLIHTINLLVEVAPRWTAGAPSQKMSLAIGGNGSLECQVTAVPAANITWYKNGKQLNLSKSHVKVDGHKLHLRDVNHINDGVYQCVAENTHGMIVSETWVRTHVRRIQALNTTSKPTDYKSIDVHTVKNVAKSKAFVEEITIQKESQSNIGVILGSLCAALGVAAIVAFVLWKKFAKRMTSDEQLRKEVIKEMKEKWKEENPDMYMQEKTSKLSNYLPLFQSIPLKVNDRIRKFLQRRPVSRAPEDIMHEDQKGFLKDLFDRVTKGGHGDHHQKINHLDAQEHQGDIHQSLTREDTEDLGDLHQRLSHGDTQAHQRDVDQSTQKDKENSHQDLQEDQVQLHENMVHEEIQEDQENLHQASPLQDTQKYQHLQEPLRQVDVFQQDPREDPQEDHKKLQQETSPQDNVEKD